MIKMSYYALLFILIPSMVDAQQDFKHVHRSFSKIKMNLYASKVELTNHEYRIFISDLKKTNQLEQLKEAAVDSVKWSSPLNFRSKYEEFYHVHPAYNNYPVVNVSHQAAIMYCNWLTDNYNAAKGRRFKEVKFRLPTEAEWEFAARGEDSTAKYTWSGNFILNDKGQYQSNVKKKYYETFMFSNFWNEFDLITPVKNYEPNCFGLYDMCGNVAEMTSDSTITKGGSWSDYLEWQEIGKSKVHDGIANPTVGFRVFMEVIEK